MPPGPPEALYPYLTRKGRKELNRMLLMGLNRFDRAR